MADKAIDILTSEDFDAVPLELITMLGSDGNGGGFLPLHAADIQLIPCMVMLEADRELGGLGVQHATAPEVASLSMLQAEDEATLPSFTHVRVILEENL